MAKGDLINAETYIYILYILYIYIIYIYLYYIYILYIYTSSNHQESLISQQSVRTFETKPALFCFWMFLG